MCRRPSFKVIDMPRVLNWLQSTEAPEGKGSRMTETTQPVFKNAAYTQEYIDIANSLDGDVPGRRAARLHGRVHGHRASPGGVHQLRAEALRRRIAPGHARGRGNHAPNPVQGHAALPRRRRIPQDLRLRPAPGRAHLGAARLRRAAAVRPLRHLPGREHRRRGVLRVQRRRQLGHEREPRDHALRGANGHLQGIRQASSCRRLRAVRRLGFRVHQHLQHV